MEEWPDEITIPDVKIVKQTEKAVWLELDTGERIWIPQSQISANSEINKKGQEGSITLNKWLVQQKDELKDYLD